jgi:hypothetical protein
MKLSAPIYRLKRSAKQLARAEGIELHAALERIANVEGFKSWSLLSRNYAASSPAAKLYAGLKPGELVLVGARPGQGKTLLALELAVHAVKAGERGVFFTLEYTEDNVLERLDSLGLRRGQPGSAVEFDCSDDICAEYIMQKMRSAPPGTLIVIDYLQLLDQKRKNAPLAEQVAVLKAFAQKLGAIIVFISQIARSYSPVEKPIPDLSDVRLPNPLNLALFTKTCFLNNGDLHVQAAH